MPGPAPIDPPDARFAERSRDAAHLALLTSAAVLLTAGFLFGSYLQIRPGVVTFFVIALYGLAVSGSPAIGLLQRLMIAIYVLPFSVLLGYLLDENYIWMLTPQGIALIEDRTLIRQMLSVGTIGLLGLLAGFRLVGMLGSAKRAAPAMSMDRASLRAGFFLPLLLAAIGLSWLSSPPETIFQAAYFLEQSQSLADKAKFSASYLVAYVLLVLLAIDAEVTADRNSRRLKTVALTAATAYTVIFLQLLRGDRESSGLLAALFGLWVTRPYLSEPAAVAHRFARRRILFAAVPLILLVATFIALGEARGRVSMVSERLGPKQTFLLGLSQNTWTAVLWTHLSSMSMYRDGNLEFRAGQTYTDYIVSLPPGFVAATFGIERPAQSRNLALEDPANVSAGGLHAVVAPFKNFGAPGAFIVLLLFGALIAQVERANLSRRLSGRLAYAAMLCTSFQWFWYGDMVFIRGMLATVLLYVMYQLMIRIGDPAVRSMPLVRSA